MCKTLRVLALASACGLALCGAARADEIYTLSGTAPGALFPFAASFDLADAQVETGAFTLFAQGSGDVHTIAGDVGGFNSLNFAGEKVTPSYVYGYIPTFDLSFDTAGDLTSVDAVFEGVGTDATITGTGVSATATFRSDDPYLCPNGYEATPSACTITGSFTHAGDPLPSPVPEPASLALLGAGLIGLAAARRHTV